MKLANEMKGKTNTQTKQAHSELALRRVIKSHLIKMRCLVQGFCYKKLFFYSRPLSSCPLKYLQSLTDFWLCSDKFLFLSGVIFQMEDFWTVSEIFVKRRGT